MLPTNRIPSDQSDQLPGQEPGPRPGERANSLRIGFDARYIDDRYHGVGRYSYELLDALTSGYPDDHFIAYHNPSRPTTRLDLPTIFARPNVEAVRLPFDIYSPLEQPAIALAACRQRLDALFVPYFPAPLLATVPVVTTVHDCIFDREPRYQTGRWVRHYYRPMMWLAPRKAKRVICVSEATAADLRHYYQVAPEKIAVVPEAAGSVFRPVTDKDTLAAVRQRYRLPERFVLALGVRRPHKNLAGLVEAFARLDAALAETPGTSAGSRVDLVLTGEPHARYDDEVPAAVARLGLAERIHSTGHVPDSDLPALYSLAEAFVLPSLLEGFGLPVLEAMSCGAPVVAANTSSLPEVVGSAGLLADPRDPAELARALARVIGDPALRRELRERGLARASEFSWTLAARRTREVIVEAVGRRGGQCSSRT